MLDIYHTFLTRVSALILV
uniref:Uncharacterized protein n=1 Tax=Rhizophora mucronata TaxID=61149 RepID=A0A2P2QG16_RHIMU